MIVGYPLQLSNSDYMESSLDGKRTSLVKRTDNYRRFYSVTSSSTKNMRTSLSRINGRAFSYRQTSNDN